MKYQSCRRRMILPQTKNDRSVDLMRVVVEEIVSRGIGPCEHLLTDATHFDDVLRVEVEFLLHRVFPGVVR